MAVESQVGGTKCRTLPSPIVSTLRQSAQGRGFFFPTPMDKKKEGKEMNSGVWIPDHATRQCYKCGTPFGLLLRRHHCRVCGRIFCADCTLFKASVPEGWQVRSPESRIRGLWTWATANDHVVVGSPHQGLCRSPLPRDAWATQPRDAWATHPRDASAGTAGTTSTTPFATKTLSEYSSA